MREFSTAFAPCKKREMKREIDGYQSAIPPCFVLEWITEPFIQSRARRGKADAARDRCYARAGWPRLIH